MRQLGHNNACSSHPVDSPQSAEGKCDGAAFSGVLASRVVGDHEYVHHGAQDVLRAQYDLHPEGIAKRVREFVRERVERPRLATIR